MEDNNVQIVKDEQDKNSKLALLDPRKQRFVHLYVSGQYKISQIAELMQMSIIGIRTWLKRPEIKEAIEELQTQEDEIVRQTLKAARLSALEKMQKLLDSPQDAIAYQAARDILDRTGHKAPTKNETKIEIYSFEQQLRQAIEQASDIEEFIDVDDYEVVK